MIRMTRNEMIHIQVRRVYTVLQRDLFGHDCLETTSTSENKETFSQVTAELLFSHPADLTTEDSLIHTVVWSLRCHQQRSA